MEKRKRCLKMGLGKLISERKQLNRRISVAKKEDKISEIANEISTLKIKMQLVKVPKNLAGRKNRELLYLEWVLRRVRGKMAEIQKKRRPGVGGPYVQSRA
jgi:seryl-tRNA synthetase